MSVAMSQTRRDVAWLVRSDDVVRTWLSREGARDLPLARRTVRDALLDAGTSRTTAQAIAGVPRHPFVPPGEWRLAYALDLDRPLLPSPFRAARMLDGLQLSANDSLLVHDRYVGWLTVVAAVLARSIGVAARTSGRAGQSQTSLAAVLGALGMRDAAAPASGGVDAVLVPDPCARPDEDALACVGAGGRVVWAADEGARVYRLQRRAAGWRLTDIGPSRRYAPEAPR